VLLTLAMLLLELSLLQLPAQLDQLAQQLIVMLPEVVLTMQLFAKLVDVQTINVTQLPTNVKLSFQIVMMVIHAPLTASTHLPAVFTLLYALLQICAQPQLVLQDNALTLQRIVMTVMFVLSILATFALELV